VILRLSWYRLSMLSNKIIMKRQHHFKQHWKDDYPVEHDQHFCKVYKSHCMFCVFCCFFLFWFICNYRLPITKKWNSLYAWWLLVSLPSILILIFWILPLNLGVLCAFPALVDKSSVLFKGTSGIGEYHLQCLKSQHKSSSHNNCSKR